MMKTITVNNIWDNIKNFKSNIKCIKVLNVRAKTINFQRKTLKEIFMTIHQSKICKSKGCSVVSDSLQPHGIYSPWNSPGQNTGVDSLSLLQGIFPTQGSNPGLPHCRQILYQLSHKGSPLYSLEPVFIFLNFFSDTAFLIFLNVKVAQSCLTFCNSMDYRVYGIF